MARRAALTDAMEDAIEAKQGYGDIWLLEMLGSGSTIRYNTSPSNVSYASLTWTGIGGMISFDAPPETADPSGQSCALSFSGVDTSVIAEVLTNEVRGRSCRIYFGQILLSTGVVVVDPLLMFKGMMNSAWEMAEQPSTVTGRGTGTIATTIISDVARAMFPRDTMTNWPSMRNMQARSSLTRTLGANPITSTASSATILITDTVAPCRIGIGSQVTISGATAFNGLTAPNMNQTFEVTAVPSENSFEVTAGGTASGSGAGGAASVVCTYGHNIVGTNADYLFNTVPDLGGKPVFWGRKGANPPPTGVSPGEVGET
jgi:hypothetical protein